MAHLEIKSIRKENMDKKYQLAICSIFKNEGRYIQEWIEYHKMIGVDHFYLYDNDSTDDITVLQKYIDEGIVTLNHISGKAQQMPAYNHFLQNYKNEVSWAAILDLDEFIVPMEQPTLPLQMISILDRAKKKIEIIDGFDVSMVAGIQLCWVYYGTSFHIDPPDGLVLENYLNRIKFEDNDNWCKCIYYVDHIDSIINPHFTVPKEGKIFIDENGDYVPICARFFSTKANYCRVNHYTTRSYNEHKYKLTERGFADGLRITEEHRERLLLQGQTQFNSVYDPITLRYIPALKNRMKS